MCCRIDDESETASASASLVAEESSPRLETILKLLERQTSPAAQANGFGYE